MWDQTTMLDAMPETRLLSALQPIVGAVLAVGVIGLVAWVAIPAGLASVVAPATLGAARFSGPLGAPIVLPMVLVGLASFNLWFWCHLRQAYAPVPKS